MIFLVLAQNLIFKNDFFIIIEMISINYFIYYACINLQTKIETTKEYKVKAYESTLEYFKEHFIEIIIHVIAIIPLTFSFQAVINFYRKEIANELVQRVKQVEISNVIM